MCELCTELDKKIAHYTQLPGGIADQRALNAITNFPADLQAKKRELHPESMGNAR
ncbi:hypothetical protein IC762_29995 [Bradyrhizobium genosp. L]|uniref:hypothetical protein n=1 Tax=Bradyrhizobium genosp. L TaxID=83637 RepID=UPI0018A2A3BB|nr:hypothetical protein [Bradyrhizobium genosp. L]QPF83863.1 hypothetical protein IC762_29995 [Bradyrhizobium genosp. L]